MKYLDLGVDLFEPFWAKDDIPVTVNDLLARTTWNVPFVCMITCFYDRSWTAILRFVFRKVQRDLLLKVDPSGVLIMLRVKKEINVRSRA